jgi:hypothetical protein
LSGVLILKEGRVSRDLETSSKEVASFADARTLAAAQVSSAPTASAIPIEKMMN